MIVSGYNHSAVTPGTLSKVEHALGLEDTVPFNDKVCPLPVWEEAVEVLGREKHCPAKIIEKAKAQYTYYMLYHYA